MNIDPNRQPGAYFADLPTDTQDILVDYIGREPRTENWHVELIVRVLRDLAQSYTQANEFTYEADLLADELEHDWVDEVRHEK